MGKIGKDSDQIRRLHACSIYTLRIFTEVVECRSFSGAARRMKLTPSTVSKHIDILERTLETPLIHRTTRQVNINEAGLILFKRVRAMLADLEEAVNVVTCETSAVKGHLLVTAPPSFSSAILRPHIAEFLEKYPKLSVEIQVTSRAVDIIREGIDVAILFESQMSSKITSIKIASDRRVFCASPAYIEQYGEPSTIADLSNHRCLINIYSARGGAWPFNSKLNMPVSDLAGSIAANDGDMLRTICLEGQGIGFFHLFHVNEYLQSGRLCEVLKSHRPPSGAIFAVVPHRRLVTRKIQVLLDHIREAVSFRLGAPSRSA